MFDQNIYEQRRTRLRQHFTKGILLFMGNDECPMNYKANPYPFRQDSTFLYYFGLNIPQVAAVIDLDNDREIIFGNEWTMEEIVWIGAHASLKELTEAVGVQKLLPYSALPNYLKARRVHFLPPYRAQNANKLHEWLGIPLANITQNASPSLIKTVVAQRSFKQPEEIIEIEKALTTTALMHQVVMSGAKEGNTEIELAAQAQARAVAVGGGTAYPIILSVNGQILHNYLHTNTLKKGQLLLGDFGAQSSMCYASDITRTTPVGHKFSEKQKDIYNIVLRAQTDTIKILRPGLSYKEAHLTAARTIAQGLKDVGLMKGDVDEAVAEGAVALFFPHGLGHAIGLDVHDMEDLGEMNVGYEDGAERSSQFGISYLRFAKPLCEDFTLTVEPGIYFIPQLIDSWQAKGLYSNFIEYEKLTQYLDFGGIRIEDNILITSEGCRVLGPHIPKTVEEIEAMY